MRIRPERTYTCALCWGIISYIIKTRGATDRFGGTHSGAARTRTRPAPTPPTGQGRSTSPPAGSCGPSECPCPQYPRVCMSACPVLRELISCNNGLRTIREGAQRDCPLGRECAERSPASEKRQVEGQAAQRRPRNCGRPRRRVRPQSASRRRPAVLCFVCVRGRHAALGNNSRQRRAAASCPRNAMLCPMRNFCTHTGGKAK